MKGREECLISLYRKLVLSWTIVFGVAMLLLGWTLPTRAALSPIDAVARHRGKVQFGNSSDIHLFIHSFEWSKSACWRRASISGLQRTATTTSAATATNTEIPRVASQTARSSQPLMISAVRSLFPVRKSGAFRTYLGVHSVVSMEWCVHGIHVHAHQSVVVTKR